MVIHSEPDACRAAFEADAEPYGYDLTVANDATQMIRGDVPFVYQDNDTNHRWLGWLAAWSARKPEGEAVTPSGHTCAKARWFILARDAGLFTWGDLAKVRREPTTPYIESQIANNPLGHITKWDVAQCVYELMTVGKPEREPA